VSTATDTFARLVDVLVDSMEDHTTSSRALASRVHIWRFHFDRLVSVAAGEPPATLRRGCCSSALHGLEGHMINMSSSRSTT
jgi:hypothetical protein